LLTLFCEGGLMQVNATLIAAQQAAREAQARFQTVHLAPRQAAAGPSAAGQPQPANFAAALEKDLFEPLPLKQNAPPPAAATANPGPASRPGSLLDIRI
jgi:hypothetical protein